MLNTLVNRRKYIRVYLTEQVHVDIYISRMNQRAFPNERIMNGTVDDISMGGLKMTFDFSLPSKVGDTLYFKLDCLGAIYTFYGKIVWERPINDTHHSYGIEFEEEITQGEEISGLLLSLTEKIK
ncbi:PilZ domain-containing protein [Calidifontibacillus oryziterrae]|uniref:PilZ domain-containing protein n=1 Tax=Calidifontibacillus oryziterrae TaxID=1191699 RepID=UPI0003701BC2|nr:PilZ domain-containing protein [Calidifontibacillus oryziterrae]